MALTGMTHSALHGMYQRDAPPHPCQGDVIGLGVAFNVVSGPDDWGNAPPTGKRLATVYVAECDRCNEVIFMRLDTKAAGYFSRPRSSCTPSRRGRGGHETAV